MPRHASKPIAVEIEAARLLIDNALGDPEARDALGTVGYSVARLVRGQRLVEAAVAAVANKGNVAGSQYAQTRTQRRAYGDLRGTYQHCVDRARLAAASAPAVLATLGIRGRTPSGTAALLLRVEIFRQGVAGDAKLRALLAEHGIDEATVAQLEAHLAAFKDAESAQEAAKGATRGALQAQAGAMDALRAFAKPLRQAARIAGKERPELLTKLGL